MVRVCSTASVLPSVAAAIAVTGSASTSATDRGVGTPSEVTR